jgi:hypothetical protein
MRSKNQLSTQNGAIPRARAQTRPATPKRGLSARHLVMGCASVKFHFEAKSLDTDSCVKLQLGEQRLVKGA